ncbi:MAG: Na(+)-translocating NADH-quinone reductase subunit A [Bacteroides sp.]|jgi:Na+-transporting NADH:ubiquinone oxidoreductase subunit A|nr:Na(+)-translocating NADH-quinone reductase subunit A [Bacteroides sp.]
MPKTIKIRKGLNIPLQGNAEKILQPSPAAQVYAVKPPDFHGLTPKMLVKEGDALKAGTPLFFDKYNEKVLFTSPVSGTFQEIVRGEKRRIMEVLIKADGKDEAVDFGAASPAGLDRDEIIQRLLKSGAWPFIRQRPYAVIANPSDKPKSIFISAFSTVPLAPDLDFVVKGQENFFQAGLDIMKKLTDGEVHLSVDALNTRSEAFLQAKGVKIHSFEGPHPAGNVGVQIHHIDPINKGDLVWYADVQDLIIIGRLFEKGVFDPTRVIALNGPEVLNPRYYKVKIGAQFLSFAENNLRREKGTIPRIISGDVLTGTAIEEKGFLGFYDNQITVIPEGNHPEFMGWLIPNINRFSMSRTWPSFLMPWKKYRLDTNIRSGERPFVMTGVYEKVLPLDVMPMQLLKAIMINDIEKMEKLGIYEVAPEDFALCEYVCPSKIEIQTILREGLDSIRSEFA